MWSLGCVLLELATCGFMDVSIGYIHVYLSSNMYLSLVTVLFTLPRAEGLCKNIATKLRMYVTDLYHGCIMAVKNV